MNINILGTKVHVALVVFGALCVLVLFGCVGVISWGGWKMNQQDEATKKHSEETADLKNLTEHLQTENEKLQEETQKLSSQMQNLNEKSQNQTENLSQIILLILKFNLYPIDDHCVNRECVLCHKDWIFFNDSCYYISKVSLSWDDSRQFCQLKSADLVVIDNLQEQEFIYDNVNGRYWLGLYGTGSNWVWIDGRIDTLRFWRSSDYYYYPYNYYYAYMYQWGIPTASWFPASSSSTYPPLCEQKAFKVSLN